MSPTPVKLYILAENFAQCACPMEYFNVTGEEPSEEVVEKLVSGSMKLEMVDGGGRLDQGTKERDKIVADIQSNLNRLHQVYLDMAVLVEAQGVQINDNEHNVAYAGDFISGRIDNLHYTKKMQKKSRRWLYWVSLVAFVILLIYIISFFAT
ncbi:hypothetical protein Droror1_Dr00025175 [Drosera rotundifolia]